MPKGTEAAQLRRSTRIAATDSPVLPAAQVRTRRSSSSSEPSSCSTPGKITRSKRLSLSEDNGVDDHRKEREKTPQRTTKGMYNTCRLLANVWWFKPHPPIKLCSLPGRKY